MKKLTFILAVLFTFALGACTDNQQRERTNENPDIQSNEMEEDMNQNDQEGGEWEETETDTTQNNSDLESPEPGL